jgi:hypothetical protein
MRFKDFINEELQGLFGKVKAANPVAIDHFKDKKFFVPPQAKSKGKSSVQAMTDGNKAVATAPMPSANLTAAKKQHTLKKPSSEKTQHFRQPKAKTVKPPLGL